MDQWVLLMGCREAKQDWEVFWTRTGRSETHWCGNSRVLRDRGCCWTWKDVAATGSTKSFLVGTAVEEA